MDALTTNYKLGSLFDGSGGFPLAGALCGIEPRWASEVEPYPIAVTRTRFKNMEHLGDISKINGAEIEPVDVITFGSPCQDLSVAGKRAGLKHEANGDEETTRSGLFMEAVRIIKEMREATNGEYPRFALWENVPGAFSSNKGEDFRIVLEELIKVVEPSAVMPAVPKNGWAYADSYRGDGWSLAYRVFDAQYWGVPQRRRRIHLVADFRGECAREVLFERQGVRGYFTEGRTPWQGAPADAQGGAGADDREGEGSGGAGGRGLDAVAYTLKMRAGCEGGGNVPMVMQPVVYDGANITSPINASNPQPGDPCHTLSTDARNYVVEVSAGFKPNQGSKAQGIGYEEEVSPTLLAGQEPGVVYVIDRESWQSGEGFERTPGVTEGGPHPTLGTSGPGAVCYVLQGANAIDVETEVAVRKYEVDKDKLVAVLREHKGDRTNKEIAEALDKPLTLVEHWFRNDKSFAIPDPDVWFKLKDLLGITTTEFDQSVTEFEFKGSNYDMRNRIYVGDTSPTLTCGCGDHLHLLPEDPVYCLQGNGIDRADTAGCNGKGWKEDVCYTLNTIDRPAVVYPTTCTDVGWLNSIEDQSPTLLARSYKDPHLVAYGVDVRNGTETEELQGTLQSRASNNLNSNNVVRVRYIVRRLTPTECARLQGFADRWGDLEAIDTFTQKDYQFWLEVRNTHAAINGKKVQEYTVKQMLTWYNKLQTDSAEYKMWGNGIALPPALYCMQGIVDALSKKEEVEDDWMI